jgi:AcrR family transcriptional regulator
VKSDWLREERPDLASDRILDAAGKAFARLGVSAAGMAEIAAEAGCSRGTLYRYFKSRHELHLAYVDRAARGIVERVREETAPVEDPRERLVAYILGSVREVRGDPGTAAWFAPGVSGMAARMSRASEVVGALAQAIGTERQRPGRAGSGGSLRARWIVRVIVSLLADPGESDAEERALVERYVVPALLLDEGD